MSFWRIALILTCFVGSLNAHDLPDKSYDEALTVQEQEDISLLVTTLSTTSTFALMFKQKELEELGGRSKHVHPLRFFRYIFSDVELSETIKEMGRIPWKRFSSRFSEKLEQYTEAGTISVDHRLDFAQTVNIDPDRIYPLKTKREWNDFLNWLTDD